MDSLTGDNMDNKDGDYSWTHNSTMEMARVLSSVHAISMTCSVCWTSLCAACLYIIARPDSQFLCTHVYFFFGDHT